MARWLFEDVDQAGAQVLNRLEQAAQSILKLARGGKQAGDRWARGAFDGKGVSGLVGAGVDLLAHKAEEVFPGPVRGAVAQALVPARAG